VGDSCPESGRSRIVHHHLEVRFASRQPRGAFLAEDGAGNRGSEAACRPVVVPPWFEQTAAGTAGSPQSPRSLNKRDRKSDHSLGGDLSSARESLAMCSLKSRSIRSKRSESTRTMARARDSAALG